MVMVVVVAVVVVVMCVVVVGGGGGVCVDGAEGGWGGFALEVQGLRGIFCLFSWLKETEERRERGDEKRERGGAIGETVEREDRER